MIRLQSEQNINPTVVAVDSTLDASNIPKEVHSVVLSLKPTVPSINEVTNLKT